MALVPTLSSDRTSSQGRAAGAVVDAVLGNAQAQLRAFADSAVRSCSARTWVHDRLRSDRRYVYMRQAGLSFARLLAALTTAPAAHSVPPRARGDSRPGSTPIW